jgi:hypothetical protein
VKVWDAISGQETLTLKGHTSEVTGVLRQLVEHVRLPSGDRLTARRFLQLGLKLGDSAGFEQIHHIVELPLGSRAFLHDVRHPSRTLCWSSQAGGSGIIAG